MIISQKEDSKKMNSSIVIGASADIVQRFGSGIKAHLASYNGMDHENNVVMKRNLRSVAQSKVNPDFKSQNINQQAGFSAEIKETAKINAQRAIKGETARKIRTDDTGSTNDQIFDHVDINKKGNVIAGSGSQMKFVGKTPDELLSKLLSPKYDKYLENDAKIVIPSDLYDGTMNKIKEEMPKLESQLESLKGQGKTDEYRKAEAKLRSLKKLDKNLRKSTVSKSEAKLARTNPKLSTAIDTAKIAHQGGMEAAKSSATLSGSISIVKNSVSMIKGEIDKKEALTNIAEDTVSSAVLGYTTGFTGSYLKGVMQSSSSTFMRNASKTNIAATVASATLAMSKTMNSYMKGEISGVECFENLGQDGTSIIASSVFSAIGQVLIPIPVVGAVIGSMVGYSMSTMTYKALLDALKDEKLAKEERVLVERECAQHIELIKEYRKELNRLINEYLGTHLDLFLGVFSEIKSHLQVGDVDGYIQGMNEITMNLGGDIQFNSMKELDDFMSSSVPFKF